MIAAALTVLLASGAGYLKYLDSKYDYVWIHGNSMTPTYKDGDILQLEKREDYVQGEIVVFRIPDAWKGLWLGEDDAKFIKRVVGVPGDVLTWDGESWSINGQKFSWVKTGACQVDPVEITIEPGYIFATGDTQDSATMDSREAFCKGVDYLIDTKLVTAKGTPLKVW